MFGWAEPQDLCWKLIDPALHILFYAHRLCMNNQIECFYWFHVWARITTFLPGFVQGQQRTLPGFIALPSINYRLTKEDDQSSNKFASPRR